MLYLNSNTQKVYVSGDDEEENTRQKINDQPVVII